MDFQTPETMIRPYLQCNERLLWGGRPAQGIKLRKHDVFLIPFSLVWCGFAIFWTVAATVGVFAGIKSGSVPAGTIIFPLFGLPFVLVGMHLVFGRFLADAKERGKTFYGVTDKRIVIVNGLFSQKIKSLDLKTLTAISMIQRADGSGTIAFGSPSNFFVSSSWAEEMYNSFSPSFQMIENVSDIYRIINEAQKDN
jgi:hypothetical protein